MGLNVLGYTRASELHSVFIHHHSGDVLAAGAAWISELHTSYRDHIQDTIRDA